METRPLMISFVRFACCSVRMLNVSKHIRKHGSYLDSVILVGRSATCALVFQDARAHQKNTRFRFTATIYTMLLSEVPPWYSRVGTTADFQTCGKVLTPTQERAVPGYVSIDKQYAPKGKPSGSSAIHY